MYIQTKTPDAISYAGSKSKLADLLGITRQSLTSWGPVLPQTSAQKLFILTDGKIGTQIDEDIKRTDKRTVSETLKNTVFYPKR